MYLPYIGIKQTFYIFCLRSTQHYTVMMFDIVIKICIPSYSFLARTVECFNLRGIILLLQYLLDLFVPQLFNRTKVQSFQ